MVKKKKWRRYIVLSSIAGCILNLPNFYYFFVSPFSVAVTHQIYIIKSYIDAISMVLGFKFN